MQTNAKVYRFSGLIALLGLLALLVGLIVMILLPDIRYAAWIILSLGILLLTFAFIVDFRRVRSALTGRRGKFGAGTTVMASIFIGITLLVNAINIGNYQRFDLTGLEQFILTSQTKDVLSNLETPVDVLGFFTPADPSGYDINIYAESLLTRYQDHTDQLSVEIIDPDEHPDQARQYGITQYQTVVFQSGDRYRLVSPVQILEGAEHAFTSAILEVTGIIQKKVYFLTGHGESNIVSDAPNDYLLAREGLLNNLYRVETLDLLFTPSIPDDADILLIAGPQKPLTNSEIEIIDNYLNNNGAAIILLNPESPLEIKQLLSSWGLNIRDGVIIDPSSYAAPNIDSPMVPRTANFFGLSVIYFPGATALIPQPTYTAKLIIDEETGQPLQVIWTSEESQIQILPLASTSEDSWLEEDFSPGEEPKYNEEIDQKGPFALSVLITSSPTNGDEEVSTEDERGTRLIVIGDSDFASNEHYYDGNNGDLFLNAVQLLTAGKELISIERKILPFRRLIVGQEAKRFIDYSSIGLPPLLVLVIGGIIWWRRR
ncbi:GldG family protein [Chloroflexota bacterium]